MIAGFLALLAFLIRVGLAVFVLYLIWRLVTAHEKLSSAQERSALALQDIASKLSSRATD
jgi:hypothetical protein